jgi:hypothetical protein
MATARFRSEAGKYTWIRSSSGHLDLGDFSCESDLYSKSRELISGYPSRLFQEPSGSMQLPKPNAFDFSIPPPRTHITIPLPPSSHLRILRWSLLCHGSDRTFRHSREVGGLLEKLKKIQGDSQVEGTLLEQLASAGDRFGTSPTFI